MVVRKKLNINPIHSTILVVRLFYRGAKKGVYLAEEVAIMSKRKNDVSEDECDALMGKAVHQMPAFRQAKCFDAITDEQFAALKISEITSVLWLSDKMSEDEQNMRIARALEFYESLAPRDGMEAMLALQMVAAHSASLECISQAGISGRFVGGIESFIKNSVKLMTLYTRQMEALNKLRSSELQPAPVNSTHRAQGGPTLASTSAPTLRPLKPQKPKHADAAEAVGPALSLVSNVVPVATERPASKPKVKRA